MLKDDERAAIADLARRGMPAVEQTIACYTATVGIPNRFALGVYDGAALGEGYVASGSVEQRVIAEFKIAESDWGERDYLDTARSKARVTLRLGRNSGDVGQNSPELLKEGEPRMAGAVLTEINGHPVVLGTSGLRQTEDELMGKLLIEAMKRLSGEYAQGGGRPR